MRPIRNSIENILIAVFIALVIRTYLVTGYKVPTSSMSPTLLAGDFIFAFRPPAGFKIPLSSTKIGAQIPDRGDLIVFTFPDQPRTNYVKRVIGTPGDRIQMQQGKLMINDQPCEYVKLPNPQAASDAMFEIWEEKAGPSSRRILRRKDGGGEDFGPLIVPPGEVFVLGDHRDASDDSRYWGTVPVDRIEGRVFLIWLSLDWDQRWAGDRLPSIRGDRLFSTVH